MHGALTAVNFAGAVITNNGTATITITGTAAAINGALNGLSFAPTADYNGSDTLTIKTNDGTLSDIDTVAITVTPVADIVDDDVITTNEDTLVNINVNANDSFENAGHTITAINGLAIVVNGSVAVTGGTVTLKVDGTLDFTPTANFNGVVPTITYTVTSGGVTETANINISVTAVNDIPVAKDDVNAVTEDAAVTTLTVTAANGVIQSASAPAGKDTDADVTDVLTVTAVRTGTELGAGTAGSVGVALAGTYGTVTLNGDGSYTYVLNNGSPVVQNLIAGEVVQDVFTYTISDGHGGTDKASLTINVTGAQDLTAGTPSVVPLNTATGLNGEYYGYNDTAAPGTGFRTHSDDGTATFGTHLAAGNLNSVEDIYKIVDGRNGSSVVGSASAAGANVADVAFKVRSLDYGSTPVVNSSLGSNSNVAAGVFLPVGDGTANSTTKALSNFLDQDRPTAIAQIGALNTGGTSGLGKTSDAAIRISGDIYVQPGLYDFRVRGDDGYSLKIAGQTLIEYDGNQAPTTRIFTNVPLGDLQGGLQSLELLYWEQGGNANLKIEYKLSNDPVGSYQVLSLTNTAMFTHENAPTIADTRIQDLVYDGASTTWQLRTGAKLDGDNADNTITGGAGRDYLTGGGGNDILIGGAGADTLDGGTGNDKLFGGVGNDLLIGGLGADTLTGGTGDDVYRLSDTLDTIVELAGEGYDTVQLDATYVAANSGTTYVLGANLENLMAYDGAAINFTGNAANNRIEGNSSDNIIKGGAGNDYISGGGGNDTLWGEAGSDTFAWHLADSGTAGSPAVDTIKDFTYGGGYSNIDTGAGVATGGGDVLDLRDLLQGEHTSSGNTANAAASVEISNLLNYIDVQIVGSNTVLHISKNGGFSGGVFSAGAEDQTIIIEGVNLYTAVTAGVVNETLLLQTLIKNGSLIVD
ncbi:MAG: type I secretion C-terminal target domain-containing protein [Cytophaga sp.]|nr:type I secretion C-terminal target domain-containing protein [Undibacterium sp.]